MPPRSPSLPTTAPVSTSPTDETESSEEPPGQPLPQSPTADPIGGGRDGELLTSPLGALAGMAIALLSVAVPLACVITDRQELPPPGFPTSLQR